MGLLELTSGDAAETEISRAAALYAPGRAHPHRWELFVQNSPGLEILGPAYGIGVMSEPIAGLLRKLAHHRPDLGKKILAAALSPHLHHEVSRLAESAANLPDEREAIVKWAESHRPEIDRWAAKTKTEPQASDL